MDNLQINMLRRKQYIILNSSLLIGMTTYYVLSHSIIAMRLMFIFLGLAILIDTILGLFKKTEFPIMYYLFPSMKILHKYNKEKLEDKSRKSKANQYVWNIVLVFLLFMFGVTWKERTAITSIFSSVFLVVTALILAISNLSLYFSNKKIDRKA